MLVACSAHGQIRVTGPADEVLVFEDVSFGPGVTNGAGLTQISGTVTNQGGDHLSNAVIKVQLFDYASRVYPRPSITCKFTIKDLVPGESKEIGEKDLREVPEHHDIRGGLTLRRKPTDCNVFLRSLKISSFSLDIISALHGRHVLTTVKAFTRLQREDDSNLPWDLLKEETEVEVLDFVPGREDPYKVKVLDDGRIGFVGEEKITVTPEAEALRQTATDSARAIQHPQQGQREVRLREKYGPDIAARISAGGFWIGMTREMALESLGKPEKISRTLLIEFVHEEWLYASGLYLYFDNGILTGYRDDR